MNSFVLSMPRWFSTKLRTAAHPLEHAIGQADETHAMMNTAGAEAALGDLETAAFAEQHVGGGHANIVECHFGRLIERAIKAEDR